MFLMVLSGSDSFLLPPLTSSLLPVPASDSPAGRERSSWSGPNKTPRCSVVRTALGVPAPPQTEGYLQAQIGRQGAGLSTTPPSTGASKPDSSPEGPWSLPSHLCPGYGPRPAPPPAVQLLLLSVLQAPVVENHTHHALWAQEGAAAFGNQLPPLGQANLASLSLTFPPTRRGQKDLE